MRCGNESDELIATASVFVCLPLRAKVSVCLSFLSLSVCCSCECLSPFSVCLCASVCLCFYVSVCLSWLSASVYVCLFRDVVLVTMSVPFLSVFLSLFACLAGWLAGYVTLCICLCVSVCLSLFLSVCLPVCLCVSLSLSLSLCLFFPSVRYRRGTEDSQKYNIRYVQTYRLTWRNTPISNQLTLISPSTSA